MKSKELLFDWNRNKWEEKNRHMYAETTENIWPWFNEALDPDILGFLQKKGITSGRILDLGTCSGSQALELAQLGYQVVGTDISQTALDKAITLNKKLPPSAQAEFLIDDILKSKLEDSSFDVILDRGCFHSICCFGGPEYIHHISRILKADGVVILKTMSILEERFVDYNYFGSYRVPMPYHFKKEELEDFFSKDFEICLIEESFFYSAVVNPPAKAWLTILQKQQSP